MLDTLKGDDTCLKEGGKGAVSFRMGCVFSKKSLSAPAFSDRSSTSTRVQHLRNNTSNGILRVPKLNLGQTGDESEISDDVTTDPVNGRNNIRLIAPPPAPTSSPTTTENTARIEPTNPPTPEHERPSIHVQYAEDLKPVSPQQSLMTDSKHKPSNVAADDTRTRSRETLDDKHRSRVSVSNVMLKPNINGIRGAPMPNQDLSIEDLDTEIDDYSGIRNWRSSTKFNPVITDILLPRRKQTQPVRTAELTNINNASANNKTVNDDAPSCVRKDTPYPNIERTKQEPLVKENYSTIKENEESINLNDKALGKLISSNPDERDKITKTKLDISLLKNNLPLKEETLEIKETQLHRVMKDKPGTLSDIHVYTDHEQEIKPENHVIQAHKTLYEQDLENSRLARKRKRTKNRQSDYTAHQADLAPLNVKYNDNFFEGSLKSLRSRPNSGTSIWTIDSKKVFGSTDTLRSVGGESWEHHMQDNYPHIKAGMTPISYRTFEDTTDIIDLEDNGDLNNDSWLSDDTNPAKQEQFDEWYGVKPYKTVSSVGLKDTGVIKNNESGPSSSELSTKQKLIYSRFARRPQSESLPRMYRKPPLPPGTDVRTRPVSETIRKTNYASSTFYTTDLDIH